MATTKRAETGVWKLFKADEELISSRAASASQRSATAHEISIVLTVHAQIEEEIFCLALRQAIKDSDWWTKPRSSTPVPRI
ncbi:hypothetical protein [Variovorax saccharolyticus]|uniref:hypothetical protein n=1 Tax=Variovorax saccharolyticus TaxID=3053516 RepID=UPI002576EF7D|nr:hypothetical protein [Variovorax sp. J22R187]MDM0022871.1 hypothetical protein [Variovorax sp. J22R187]